MKCVILCGGKGMRMGEIGEKIPKSLIKIGDKPIVEHIMDHYASYGIKEFVLCLGHLGEKIKDYFSNKKEKHNITLVDTGVNSSKTQRLLKIKDLLGEVFLVSYGDDLSNVNISKLVEFHKKEGKIATLVSVRLPNPYGTLELNEFEPSLVSKFREKPLMKDWINGGYFVFNKSIFEYLDENSELENDALKNLSEKKQLCAYRHPGFWKSINTLKDSIELNELYSEGELEKYFKNNENFQNHGKQLLEE